MEWPKAPTWWIQDQKAHVSVPFTWNLPEVRRILERGFPRLAGAVAGGPAVYLMPDYLSGIPGVEIGRDMPGVLQRVNPLATRTTTGCIRSCGFCGVRRIEPTWAELDDWPDFPILADNNLLAASVEHFDRVMDRLEVHGWADFTQGIDSRLLTDHHAKRIARLKDRRTKVRLALDSMTYSDGWENAFQILRKAGVAKAKIWSYAIIGFKDGPEEAWRRCEWIEAHGVMALPMWFHPLDAMEWNRVTPTQADMGWSLKEQQKIMGFYYWHRGEKPAFLAE